MSQKDKILELLQERGDAGASSRDLNNIAYRYSARIKDLRDEGHEIETKPIKKGLYKFTIKQERQQEVDRLIKLEQIQTGLFG